MACACREIDERLPDGRGWAFLALILTGCRRRHARAPGRTVATVAKASIEALTTMLSLGVVASSDSS